MAKRLFRIKRNELCKSIVSRLLNKFDFFLVLEGDTGTGKSTLAIQIAFGVKSEFKKLYKLDPETVEHHYNKVIVQQGISKEDFCKMLLEMKEKKQYNFRLDNDLIYDQKSMLRGLTSWKRIIIPDELVNVSFNRDFQGDMQKKIIKAINMFRDHNNLIIASVPQFINLDVQIKALTKMRIAIAKRGVGVVQTPNKTIYSKDKWDTIVNEKIEREWIKNGNKPKYTKLTTSRGLISFPPLPKKLEEKYQKVKDAKRSNIVEVEMGVKQEDNKKKEPFDLVYELLTAGKIRNAHELDGFALAHGLEKRQMRDKLRRVLEKNLKPNALAEYFWDKRISRKQLQEDDRDALASLQ